MRHIVRTVLTALGAAALATTLGATAAHADANGTTTSGGYGAEVEVHLTGDVNRATVASIPGPPPLCWWEDYSSAMLDSDKVDTTDPVAVQEYIDKMRPFLTGHAAVGSLAIPDDAYLKDIIARVKAGEKMTFYRLETAADALTGKPGTDTWKGQVGAIAKACGTTSQNSPFGPILMSVLAFPTGQEPPPAVDPKDLAAYAYEVMDLKSPSLEWNPRLASSDDATLVNLPTWLWTRDRLALEERQVTAEAAGVSVTVTAEPNGMTVSTPVGGTDCSAKQARTAYGPGVDEASACVFVFPLGSFQYADGFPVQATTGWQATWTSNAGPGGDLEPKTMTATTAIPVIEVQSRVNSTS